jgi:hypothetical protein
MTILSTQRRARALAVAALTTAALALPSVALAHPGHGPADGIGVTDEGVVLPGGEASKLHGGEGGHLPGSSANVVLVGRSDIEGAAPDRVADVAAFGNYAYLTVRDPAACSGAGVAVFDISDPVQPRQVGFIDATEGSFPGEGAQVVDLVTPAFRGQVLVFNNEVCVDDPATPEPEPVGEGGVSLWDVTDPLNPQLLTAHAGDPDPSPQEAGLPYRYHLIHSALAWQDGLRAFVAIVDNQEAANLDILEITDPRAPVLLSEVDLNTFHVLQEGAGRPLGGNSFLHDIEVQRVRGTMTLVASYWDGGWVLLDVDDPANPIYLRDFDYPTLDAETGLRPSEGNAHQAEFSRNGRLLIGTDEDFSPYRATLTSGQLTAQIVQGTGVPQVDVDTPLVGTPVFVGRACDADPVDPAPPGASLAVVERGVCPFTEKLRNVQEAGGYTGVILMQQQGPAACSTLVLPGVDGDLPFISVGHDTAYALFGAEYDEATCRAETAPPTPFPVGTVGSPLTVAAVFDGWGYVRLLETRTMQQIDTYAIPESLDAAFAEGFGHLSVHEVAVDPWREGLAYLSYYSGGVRVLSYNRNGMREVGHYIDEGGSDFWGVEVHRLPGRGAGWGSLILASDRDSGLWIFRYTGR